MVAFHTTLFVFATAGVLVSSAIEPQVSSSQIHCEAEDFDSELQSVSMLQRDTVLGKAKQSATMRAMAELTPSGEAVSLSEDESSSEDDTVSIAVPVHGLQLDTVAEQHRPHVVVQRAADAAINLAEPSDPINDLSTARDVPVRKAPMVESIAGAHARRKTRRALPGVSLLGRMSATVARHGLHAAHKAGAMPHAPVAHEEAAETMLVALCLFLFAIFSIGCLVLEHRSKDRAQAHAKRFLTRTLDGPAVESFLKVPADVKQPEATDLQQPVGEAITVPHAAPFPPSMGANFSVGLDVLAGQRADAFEVLDHAGLAFCTVTLSDTPNGARCLAVTCSEDEGRNCCVIAPPDVADGLQVFGFKGKMHGIAQQDSSRRLSLHCEGQQYAVVEGLNEEVLQQTMFAPNGAVLASSRRDPEAWVVRVEPGSDEVLAIVLLLARVLLTQDAVGTEPVQVS